MAGGEHLVGEAPPHFPGLARLAGRDGKDINGIRLELGTDRSSVKWPDVRVGDDRVAVGGRELADQCTGFGKEAGLHPDGGARELDLADYQVTSPDPARTFATLASMKRRSESRLR